MFRIVRSVLFALLLCWDNAGRKPSCGKGELVKGAWIAQEDLILTTYIKAHAEGEWGRLPKQAGLRCSGKSCRLQGLNYFRPDIKQGNITDEEEDLIIRLHKLLGNKWYLIAGRPPGRTDNKIKNYWNTCLRKKVLQSGHHLAAKEVQPFAESTPKAVHCMKKPIAESTPKAVHCMKKPIAESDTEKAQSPDQKKKRIGGIY